jgi:hypothetical protein
MTRRMRKSGFNAGALGVILALCGVLAAQSGKAPAKVTRFGAATVRGYTKFSAKVRGDQYTFSFTGAGTQLTWDTPEQWVQLTAPSVSAEATRQAARAEGFALGWAKASSGVKAVVRQKDPKGTVIRVITAWADQMRYSGMDRTFVLEGSVKVETDDPPMRQTAERGTVRFEGSDFTVDFDGEGVTELLSGERK